MRRSRVPGELEVALLLAGGQQRRLQVQPRVRELLGRADLTRLERGLAERRLLPLIGSRVLAAGGDVVPESFRAAVHRATVAARAQGLAVEWATRRVVSLLADAGIPSLPLKGVTLASDVHGDLGLRPTSDVDLLVPRAALDDASRVLMEQGFSPPTDLLRRNGLPDLHLVLSHPELVQVELHWRIHWHEEAFSADMLARSSAGSDGLARPTPEDLVASLLLFHSRDGFHGLRPALDLAAWWDRHGEEPAKPFLESHARSYPQIAAALSAAARVVEPVAAVPATRWLGGAAVGGRRVELAARLADWTQHGDREQLRANISLVGGLLGPPSSGLDFVRRELLSYRAGRFGRPGHFVKRVARYLIALWSLRRGRAWTPAPTLE